MRRPLRALLAGLALAVSAVAAPARADGAWLDGPRPNWNVPGGEIPAAPPMDPAVNPRCLDQQRPPETDEDRRVVEKGWTLFGDYRAGWGVVIVKGLSGYDGMCRPLGYQQFVFRDGVFIGTISPAPMDSRTDGAGEVEAILGRGQIFARYRRYAPSDPLCCPSGASTVTFEIDERGPAPVLLPTGGTPVVSLTAAENGQAVTTRVGARVVVNVAANPTTGYRWRVADGLDPAVLRQAEYVYEPESTSGPPRVGAGGTDHWTFEAVGPGTTTLTLEYARPSGGAPVQTFQVTVVVEG